MMERAAAGTRLSRRGCRGSEEKRILVVGRAESELAAMSNVLLSFCESHSTILSALSLADMLR